jgi:hypothetical protein
MISSMLAAGISGGYCSKPVDMVILRGRRAFGIEVLRNMPVDGTVFHHQAKTAIF